MLETTELFETALSWLRNNYPNFRFFQERDIVWTIQTRITEVIKRDNEFVSNGKTKVAYSVFIDEGGYFRHRSPHPQSKWIDWNMSESQLNQISVLWSQANVK